MMTGKKLNWYLTGFITFFMVVVIGSSVQAQIDKIEMSIEEVTDQKTPYLNYPVAVLVQEGSDLVLICDWANDRLVITDQNGKTQKIVPGLEGPVGMVYDSMSNRLYLTEQKANRIRILDGSTFAPVGEFKIQGITLNEPRGLWMDEDRKIYLVDTMNSRIVVFDQDGNLIRTIGKEGMGDDEFYYPRGVSVDSQGRIWMTDTLHHTVKVFDPAGNYLFRIGKGGSGPDELDRPRYVIVKDETVIISDYRNNRLKIHNTQGELIGIVDRIGGDYLLNPEGLWIDSNGYLWVADSGNNRIVKLDMTFLMNREAYLASLLSKDKIDEFLREAASLSPEKRQLPELSALFYTAYQKKDDLENMIVEAENLWMIDEENRSTWSEELGKLYYRKATLSRATQPASIIKDFYRKSIQYGYKKAYIPYVWTSFLMLGGSNLFLIILLVMLLVLLFVLYRIRIARTRRW
ncbi:NHL repeat-containing protein [Atribacter laminatus]|uniref:Serine/threonine-protein kinase PknD n=1 Tax=Atribacter laminatus TaxID=2847778 RepID=A0A7T1F4B9_ATRLM|nr:NHL repeat-containing protein [Atribacter laminatus]QPM69400.1 Serine/threonine-protein kinase PknD [Atribacter laminatus]